MEMAYFHWFLLLTKAVTVSGNQEHSTNHCLVFDQQQDHPFPFSIENILLRPLVSHFIEK
jgi:hypothetical protein